MNCLCDVFLSGYFSVVWGFFVCFVLSVFQQLTSMCPDVTFFAFISLSWGWLSLLNVYICIFHKVSELSGCYLLRPRPVPHTISASSAQYKGGQRQREGQKEMWEVEESTRLRVPAQLLLGLLAARSLG